jgi:NAD(P)-dependent dehydrogenase (short-subunit alcohol dehydrogenase family)
MTSERKVVVITGASRGIGAQLSKAYKHIGYQVIASSRSMRKSDNPAILVIAGHNLYEGEPVAVGLDQSVPSRVHKSGTQHHQ